MLQSINCVWFYKEDDFMHFMKEEDFQPLKEEKDW